MSESGACTPLDQPTPPLGNSGSCLQQGRLCSPGHTGQAGKQKVGGSSQKAGNWSSLQKVGKEAALSTYHLDLLSMRFSVGRGV